MNIALFVSDTQNYEKVIWMQTSVELNSSTDDKQAQDFIINCLLPAAKAMTLQPHQ